MLSGSEPRLRTPVQTRVPSQQLHSLQPSPHAAASALEFTQSSDLLVSPILQSPLLNDCFSPMDDSGSEQPSSREEEPGPQGDFSVYPDSHPQTPVNHGHRKITSAYSQDPASWCVNPWMAPPMPFPPPWQYWAPWASFPRQHTR